MVDEYRPDDIPLFDPYGGPNPGGGSQIYGDVRTSLFGVGPEAYRFAIRGDASVFGTGITGSKATQIDIQYHKITDPDTVLDIDGGNTTTATLTDGQATFSTGTDANGVYIAESDNIISYNSGNEIYAGFTAAWTQPPTAAGDYATLGLSDGNDGYEIGYKGTEFGIRYLRGGTEQDFIPQSSFNVDALDGSASSTYTRDDEPVQIDPTTYNIWRVRFGWFGVAPTRIEVMAPDGHWVVAHKFDFTGNTVPQTETPNLPLRINLDKDNSDSTDITVATGCWTGGVIGNIGVSQQPDGDYVSDRADGAAFESTAQLNAGETFTSKWVKTDGWKNIEVLITSDVESAFEGVVFQFTDDVDADTPEVIAESTSSFAGEAVERGFEVFQEETTLDGVRLKYINGDVASTTLQIFATLRADAHSPDSASYVRNNTQGESYVQVGTTDEDSGIEISRPTSLFGDIDTIERRTVVDLTSTFGTSILRDETTSTGSGSVSQNPDPATGEIVLSTGTTADSSIQLQSAEYGRYTAGFSAQSGMGIRIPTLPTEGEARWGYFDDDNGFYFGYDGDQGEEFIARRSNGTETSRTYRSNWNRKDIERVLNRTWDASQGDIFQIDFSWYGYGIVLFSIVTQTDNDALPGSPRQRTVPVHAIAVENETSTTDPNEPLRVIAENAGTGEDYDVRVGGRQFSVFGELPQEERITAQTQSGVSVDETAWVYVMSWRRKAGEPNSRLNIDSFDSIQTGDTRFALLVNPNISGTNYVTPDLVNVDETLLEVSTTGSFDGIGNGTKVFETISVGGGGNKEAGAASDVNANIGQNNELVLVARGVDGNSTVDATMRMIEDW